MHLFFHRKEKEINLGIKVIGVTWAFSENQDSQSQSSFSFFLGLLHLLAFDMFLSEGFYSFIYSLIFNSLNSCSIYPFIFVIKKFISLKKSTVLLCYVNAKLYYVHFPTYWSPEVCCELSFVLNSGWTLVLSSAGTALCYSLVEYF